MCVHDPVHVMTPCFRVLFVKSWAELLKVMFYRCKILHSMVSCDITNLLREHPFNLKGGGGAMFFWGKKFLSANLMEKKILSLTWAEKNILFALWALKNIVFVEKK